MRWWRTATTGEVGDCAVCGYSMLGLTGPRCPECGGDLQAGVAARARRRRRRTIGLLLVAAAPALQAAHCTWALRAGPGEDFPALLVWPVLLIAVVVSVVGLGVFVAPDRRSALALWWTIGGIALAVATDGIIWFTGNAIAVRFGWPWF